MGIDYVELIADTFESFQCFVELWANCKVSSYSSKGNYQQLLIIILINITTIIIISIIRIIGTAVVIIAQITHSSGV